MPIPLDWVNRAAISIYVYLMRHNLIVQPKWVVEKKIRATIVDCLKRRLQDELSAEDLQAFNFDLHARVPIQFEIPTQAEMPHPYIMIYLDDDMRSQIAIIEPGGVRRPLTRDEAENTLGLVSYAMGIAQNRVAFPLE